MSDLAVEQRLAYVWIGKMGNREQVLLKQE